MKPYQVQPWSGHQCRQPLHEFHRREYEVRCALLVPGPRGLELEYDVALAVDGEALIGDVRARDVAAQLLDPLPVIGLTMHACVQAEACPELVEGPWALAQRVSRDPRSHD